MDECEELLEDLHDLADLAKTDADDPTAESSGLVIFLPAGFEYTLTVIQQAAQHIGAALHITFAVHAKVL